MYGQGGFFEYKKQDNLVETIIAKTSNKSGIMSAAQVTDLGYNDLIKNYYPVSGEHILALLLEGNFSSYFKSAPTDNPELIAKLPIYLHKAQKEGKLLLLGDSDIVNEILWNAKSGEAKNPFDVIYSSDNMRFLRNVFDYMTNSGYTNVVKKNAEVKRYSIRDIFYVWAVSVYDEMKQNTVSRLNKVNEDILELQQNIQNVKIASVKMAKNLEQMMRQEHELNQAIKKINYLTEEKYNLFVSLFVWSIVLIVPLLMSLLLFIAYTLYNRKVMGLAKRYVNE
jgi:hypothetical protein